MDDLKLVGRWIAYFPWGLFLGIMATALLVAGGNWLVGSHAIPSAVVIFVATCLCPIVAVAAGCGVAPFSSEGEQVPAVRWVMLFPFLVLCLVLGYNVLTGSVGGGTAFSAGNFPSLSEHAQSLLVAAGLLTGTFLNIVVDVSKKLEGL